MSTITPPLAATPLTPTSDAESRQALNAECINRMLAGLPFPEGIAPRPYAAPAASRRGLSWILDGPAGDDAAR